MSINEEDDILGERMELRKVITLEEGYGKWFK